MSLLHAGCTLMKTGGFVVISSDGMNQVWSHHDGQYIAMNGSGNGVIHSAAAIATSSEAAILMHYPARCGTDSSR